MPGDARQHPLLLAQRPLPSMMIATWRGTVRVSGTLRVELVNIFGTIGINDGKRRRACRGRVASARPLPQIAIRSVSFVASSLSISAMKRSVSFCTSA